MPSDKKHSLRSFAKSSMNMENSNYTDACFAEWSTVPP